MIITALPLGRNAIRAIDEHGHQLFVVNGQSVISVTAAALTVRNGQMIYTYDDKGHRILSMCSPV